MKHAITSELNGKKVLILGGSSGLGLATAKAAAGEGAQVVIVSGNQQRLEQALKELPSETIAQAVNLSQEAQIQAFFENSGNFDHLVYTAGENLKLDPLVTTTLESARNFFNIRFWGAFAALKYGASKINPGGSIVLTTGIASLRPGKGWSLGASICGAMDGFTRAMAMELAPLRVNAVSPGVVKTNLWSGMSDIEREQLYETVGNALPVQRVGEAEDIAKAYIYLMKQSFTTGQIHVVDGGTVLV